MRRACLGGSGGIADGWGGLHPFRINGGPTPPPATNVQTGPGRYVARGVSVIADATGGYTVDGSGRMWGFNLGTVASGRVPRAPAGPSFRFDIARGITGA